MGVLILFLFDQWGYEYFIYYVMSGNLDKRGIGDIWMFIVDEYVVVLFRFCLVYCLYCNLFVMFGLGLIYVFLFKNRFN